jgi:pantetheine-phosphate adenylyltransferase
VDFCRAQRASVLIKGLRAVSDFDYELQIAQMNMGLAGVETLFMPTNPLYSFLSSSLVKDVAKWGGDISAHVPDPVREALQARLGRRLPDHGSSPFRALAERPGGRRAGVMVIASGARAA